ncbi:MAG TPA: 3-hydroxyacyl-CoA dehydrogenase/enoyl-CoA hydratase family protein, partial [Anaerolineae bacterium]|nr:3-hydroxyacyl-CoA dehydrogenase/enoyl-CoA hydratase family protein [Anaerolineae bacterium]
SDDFKARFLGTHFFNPPRYLKLLEIIPTEWTSKAVVAFMSDFGRNTLGKGVVVCKDTPNFIANRFISITGSYAVNYALDNGYSIAEVDALTGPLVGRPKTGTFRLTDLVGLDVMYHVNKNLYPAIPHDKYRDVIKGEKANALVNAMMERKWLGNKTGQGHYKKGKKDGKRVFLTLDPATMTYSEAPKPRFESVGKTRKIRDLGKRVAALLEEDDRAANYVRATTYFNLAYAAYVAQEIAHSLKDIDDANRWGFAHEAGPFQLWDMLGVRETAEKMQAAGYEVADWVQKMLDDGNESFYKGGSYYDWNSGSYKLIEVDKQIVQLSQTNILESNSSANLRDMGDGIAIVEFTSKMNAIDGDMVAMLNTAIDRLESDFDGLVIGNEGKDFCVGANIGVVGIAAAQGMWDTIDREIKALQQLTMRMKHAPKPVVTAPHQRVLGGGVEMTMAGWASVADHETYMGLVEVGVGVIPAGGGLKELLERKINPVMETKNSDVLPVMQDVFVNVATAKVGTSAWEDRALGYLRDDDVINFGSEYRLGKAKALARQLADSGAHAPEIKKVYAAGKALYYTLLMGLKSFQWGNYASEHDVLVGKKLAWALCGGDLSAGTWVDPWHILDLEREGFLSLCGEKKTQERIMHMLQTGKPLRN